jgi:hypothetical protein
MHLAPTSNEDASRLLQEATGLYEQPENCDGLAKAATLAREQQMGLVAEWLAVAAPEVHRAFLKEFGA